MQHFKIFICFEIIVSHQLISSICENFNIYCFFFTIVRNRLFFIFISYFWYSFISFIRIEGWEHFRIRLNALLHIIIGAVAIAICLGVASEESNFLTSGGIADAYTLKIHNYWLKSFLILQFYSARSLKCCSENPYLTFWSF